MITNNLNFERQTATYDLRYSDHLAQTVYIKVEKQVVGPTAIKKRQELMHLLQEESLDEDFFIR